MTESPPPFADWTPPPRPEPELRLKGVYARLEPLRPGHAAALHAAFADADRIWDYLPYGPFATVEDHARWIAGAAASADPHFFAVRAGDASPSGVMSLLRIAPEAGSIEVGHIRLAPSLQRTQAATEAIYLLARWSFDAGYRRFEWKCDAANRASRRAAQRFGFSYEGVFRQHMIVKGRNRDSAWFAMTDSDWRALAPAYAAWLAPENFDAAGRQRTRLRDLTRPSLFAADPG